MSRLPPIPTPRRVLWREFRMRVVPFVVFGACTAIAVLFWIFSGGHGNAVGVAEGVRSVVASSQPGLLRSVHVRPYQRVRAGETLAWLEPQDARAQLDRLRTELDLLRTGREPTLAEENALDYERIRIELFRSRAELAAAQVNLLRSEGEVARNRPLQEEQLVSRDAFDLMEKTRDLHRAEMIAASNTVVAIEERLAALQPLGEPGPVTQDSPEAALQAGLEALRQATAATGEPIPLLAPIDGMVSFIHRGEAEQIIAGEPIITLQSLESDRIVGYLRQPYPVDLAIGHPVRVTTRDRPRRSFLSTVEEIGAQIEPITNAIAYLRPGALVDAGLPFVVGLPPSIRIRPGEIVDLQLTSPAAPASPTQARSLPSRHP